MGLRLEWNSCEMIYEEIRVEDDEEFEDAANDEENDIPADEKIINTSTDYMDLYGMSSRDFW